MNTENSIKSQGAQISRKPRRICLPTKFMNVTALALLMTPLAVNFSFANGPTYAWGEGTFGQLGISPAGNQATPVPVATPMGVSFQSVSGGTIHTLAVADDGSLWSWGTGSGGRLGIGTSGSSLTPIAVNPLPDGRSALAVAAGASHSLALAADGTIWAWGSRSGGVLGDGLAAGSVLSPTNVTALPSGRLVAAIATASAGSHNLALANDGTLWAWGSGQLGQMGNATFAVANPIPVQVNSLPGGRTPIAIACGGTHSLALASDGTIWAWGQGSAGQLGIGSQPTQQGIPAQVNPIPGGAKAIAAGRYHSLAVANDGSVWAWGSGAFGAIGNGVTTFVTSPAPTDPLPGGRKAIQVAAGEHISWALAEDGTVWSWGLNSAGQLGNGSPISSGFFTNTPVLVSDLPPATQTTLAIGSGNSFAFAIVGDANHAPVANPQNILASDSAPTIFTLDASDPDEDPLTLTIDTLPASGSISTNGLEITYTPFTSSCGVDAFSYTVSDPFGGNATATVTIAVEDNTAPVITLNGVGSLTLECGIDTYFEPGASATDACDPSVSVVIGGDTVDANSLGTYVVTYDASDASGNVAVQVTRTVTVQDTTAPVMTLNGDASLALECGIDTYTELGASVTDACDASVSVVVGGDMVDANTVGTYVVTYDATDASGNVAVQVTRTVTVHDTSAPTITILAPSSGQMASANSSIPFTAEIDEACGLQSVVWEIRDFEDQVTSLPAMVTGPAGSVYAVADDVAFSSAGIYSITLVATDDSGNASEVSVVTDENDEQLPAFVVIYDPLAGFVSGGGWIWSPEGAFHPGLAEFADITGKARFGFTSKYNSGATVPSGKTAFRFQAGELDFKSTDYQWLVVAGKRAQYKGAGTINDEGDYQFMLTAIDGDLTGGDGNDRFRIKIWDEGSDLIIYDNQADTDDAAELGDPTVIEKGQIMIHKN